MGSEKVKVRAAVWVDGRQRQKVGYFESLEDAASWKSETESLMQRLKQQKALKRRLGDDHPQVQVINDILRSEGSQCWRVNDFFSGIERARQSISQELGEEYPLLLDSNDLSTFFEKRVEQGVSLGELDIEASLLKIIFQWGARPQPQKGNKVQVAYECVVACYGANLLTQNEPYHESSSVTGTEGEIQSSGEGLAARIEQLSKEGLPQRRIAGILDINQSTVSRALKKSVMRSDA